MAIDEFEAEVRKVVDYFRQEFQLSYGEAVGVLQIISAELCMESLKDDDDD